MTREGHGNPTVVPAGRFKKVCPGCGITFRTDTYTQKYCSLRCKRSTQNRRAYEKQKQRRRETSG